jgi:hypothetical protein
VLLYCVNSEGQETDTISEKLMNEEQIRARLAKEFKLAGVSNADWNFLIRKDLVQPGMRVGDNEWEDLVRETKELLEHRREEREEEAARRKLRRGTSEEELDLLAYEKARAEAVGEYIALHASMDSQVRRFRKMVLEGELLTPQQAYDFVSSPANQCFPIAWFVERQIPMREHYSRNYTDKQDYPDHWNEDEKSNRYRFDDIYVEPPGEGFRKVTYEPLDPSRRDSLSFPFTSDSYRGVEQHPVEIDSVLDMLRQVSDQLAKGFGVAWEEAQAAWFVLTGETTPVMVLQGQIDSFWTDRMRRGTITVTAEPWISAESVESHYRMMRRMKLNDKTNRRLSKRNLALFRFVIGQFRAAVPDVEKPDPEATTSSQSGEWEVNETPPYLSKGAHPGERGEVSVAPFTYRLPKPELAERPSWDTLRERWNRSCTDPKWKYSDRGNFHRAFFRVARVLLSPAQEDEEMLGLLDAKDLLP